MVGAPAPKAKIADLVWIGGGAIAGLVAMVVFAGGLGSGDDTRGKPTPTATVRTRTLTPAPRPGRPAATTTAPARTGATTSTAAGTTTTGPAATTTDTDTTGTDTGATITAPAGTSTDTTGTPFQMTVGAKPDKTVYIEVRAGGPSGQRLFAGEVGKEITRTFSSTDPLWIGFGWAPNAVVTIDGREVAAEGGTDAFTATADGLVRVAGGG